MAPVPGTIIVSIAMSLFAFSVSMVSMTVTLSELSTKPAAGANCWDDLPCAKTGTCQSVDCIGAPGATGARGSIGPIGPPGVCSCNATGSITNAMIVANANITRSKIAPGAPNHVVINDASGFLSSERFLNVTRGGTGGDSSASSGVAKLNNGTWSYSLVQDADIGFLPGINRLKMLAGSINQVLINDGFGLMSSEARLNPFRGGTGLDTTSSTGVAHVTSGSWFIGPITFSDISAGTPNSVIVSNAFGFLTNQTFLSTILGGTGVNSASSTGIPHVTPSGWTFSQITNSDINSTAAIDRTKIACTVPFSILVNDQNGCMSEQSALNATLGGTGINTASSTGIPHILSGTWSVSQIVNADVASGAAIVRGKLAATNANEVVINDNLGIMTTEPQLSSFRGGTGADSSSSNGFAFVSGGTWSFVPGAINSSSGVIMATALFSPLLEYTGGDMQILATQNNASLCLKANGTSGHETICFVIGTTTMGIFNSEGLRLPYLSASQAVVTDVTKGLISFPYTDAATPSSIASRDVTGASSFVQVNTPTVHSDSTLDLEAPNSFVSINGLNPTVIFTDLEVHNANPLTDNTYDLGTSTVRWKNLFTSAMVNTPLLDYDNGSMVIRTTATNSTLSIGVTATGGAEQVKFTMGASTVGLFTSAGLRLTATNASQALVTDAHNNIISMPFSSSDIPLSIVSRDATGSVSFGNMSLFGVDVFQVLGTDIDNNVIGFTKTTSNTGNSVAFRAPDGSIAFSDIFSFGTVSATTAVLTSSTDPATSSTDAPLKTAGGLAVANNIYVSSGGIFMENPTTDYSPASLNYYEEANIDLVFSGAFPGTFSFHFTRIGRMVVMEWENILDGDCTPSPLFSDPIPDRFWPWMDINTAGQWGSDNGGLVSITLVLSGSTGTITLGVGVNQDPFTEGSCSMWSGAISYMIT